MKNNVIIIGGSTASGKSKTALELAQLYDSAIIINADSMQVYQELNILTACPSPADKEIIPHHLYQYIKGDQDYSVQHWLNDCVPLIKQAWTENITPIVVGGTGFYISSLLNGLSPIPAISETTKQTVRELFKQHDNQELYDKMLNIDQRIANRFPVNDSQRLSRAWEVFIETEQSIIQYYIDHPAQPMLENANYQKIVINPGRELIYNNCNQRLIQMFENGAMDEVKHLLSFNYPAYCPVMKSLGVSQITNYLNNDCTYEQALEQAQQQTRNFAKRQLTWFRNQLKDATIFDPINHDVSMLMPKNI